MREAGSGASSAKERSLGSGSTRPVAQPFSSQARIAGHATPSAWRYAARVTTAPESPPGAAAWPAPALPIRAARAEDIDAYVQHIVEHVAESGKEGAPHFAMSRRVQRDEVRHSALTRWTRRLDEPLWGRSWLLWDAARSPDAGAAPVPGHERARRARVVGH